MSSPRLISLAFALLLVSCKGTSTGNPPGAEETRGIAFEIADNARALLLIDTGYSGSDQSNLRYVGADNQLGNPLPRDNFNFERIVRGPDGRIFFISSSIGYLQSKCGLWELRPSKEFICLESEYLEEVGLLEGFEHVQWDDARNLYYLSAVSTSYRPVLRKLAPDGTRTDLTDGNVEVRGFAALGNGDVVLAGNSNSHWVRRLTRDGALSTLLTLGTGENIGWIKTMPNGTAYFAKHNLVFAIAAGETAMRAVEVEDPTGQNFWANYGGAAQLISTAGGKVYGVANWSPHYLVTQIYPRLRSVQLPQFSKVVRGFAILDHLVLTALDKSGKNRFILFNSEDDSVHDLMPGREIEVFRAVYDTSTNGILYEGLDFASGKTILGLIDMIGAARSVLISDLPRLKALLNLK